jgi:triosephosphate isomerase
MNLDHQQAIALVQKLDWSLKDAGHDYSTAEVAVFPGFTSIRSVQTLIDADDMKIVHGAQDISAHQSGAFTGEVSGLALKKLAVKYVLVGHSERRQLHGESDDIVHAKTKAAFENKIVPIICVGETQEELDEFGAAMVPVRQVLAALDGQEQMAEFVVAYEPVWAIGTGQVATPEQAASVAKKIREALAERFGADIAAATRILYGGSVKAVNVAGFLRSPEVDGVLVGGASLDADEFSGIARFEKHLDL